MGARVVVCSGLECEGRTPCLVRKPGDEAELVQVVGHGNQGREPGQSFPRRTLHHLITLP